MTDALRDRVGHTEGPWLRVDTADYAEIRAAGASQAVALVGKPADADLIAAAPELLEALVEAERHFGPFAEITINGQRDPEDVRVTALIRAAIAKATGATS